MTGMLMVTKAPGCGGGGGGRTRENEEDQNQLSIVALLIAALRKSMVACRVDQRDDLSVTVHQMEIGWPTNVQHLTHVTFDRFHGFLGLPVEFQVEIPCKVPSASISVFGVSAESMQCSYDTRGNSVPTILLLMQDRLYTQGGLKAEGIFRINPENSKEEHVRDQLNRGIVPEDIDVHCLAGLIKAWFRELPSGVLDGLSPEEVLECNTEEESVELMKQLKPTETALLNWAVDLMADVVEHEESNKMNARNIAMVFAPNMTQMSDPLTALMHAVQVMNLLKTLITKTLREREENGTTGGYSPLSSSCSFDSQQEDIDTSCELRRPPSDREEGIHYSNTSEDDDDNDEHEHEHEIEVLTEIEERFLKQLYNNGENSKNSFRIEESLLCDNENRIDNSGFSTSDEAESSVTSISVEQKAELSNSCESRGDTEMVDKMVDSGFLISN